MVAQPVPVGRGQQGQPQGSPSLPGGLEVSRSAEPSQSEVAPSLSEGLLSPTGASSPSSIAAREPVGTQTGRSGGHRQREMMPGGFQDAGRKSHTGKEGKALPSRPWDTLSPCRGGHGLLQVFPKVSPPCGTGSKRGPVHAELASPVPKSAPRNVPTILYLIGDTGMTLQRGHRGQTGYTQGTPPSPATPLGHFHGNTASPPRQARPSSGGTHGWHRTTPRCHRGCPGPSQAQDGGLRGTPEQGQPVCRPQLLTVTPGMYIYSSRTKSP